MARIVDTRAKLVRMLQDAHAGELAAAHAYRRHAQSLRKPALRSGVAHIEAMEWHHRALVAAMLRTLGERPRYWREFLMDTTGRFFGLLCFAPGRFGPMYAAGRLEAMNVGQYASARDWAAELGLVECSMELEEMRAEEDRHEQWFGDQVRGHFLLPITKAILGWAPPPPPQPIAPSSDFASLAGV